MEFGAWGWGGLGLSSHPRLLPGEVWGVYSGPEQNIAELAREMPRASC